MLSGKSILITGGTGTLGKALTREILNRFPNIERLIIFSRDEVKQLEMMQEFPTSKYASLRYFLGDIRDLDRVRRALENVDYVIHAAALKQVPTAEYNPDEAIKTNILGTNNVLSVAGENNVKKVIVLSTDKAAYPINAMGMTKALMEKVMVASSRESTYNNGTIFCGTRYGNVMASRGSVIPLFVEQIKSSKDITITNPEMTRFMMDLTNAVDLVMHAFEKGDHGDIFVQKSPAVTIKILAEALIDLYNSKSKIKYIGVRFSFSSILGESDWLFF